MNLNSRSGGSLADSIKNSSPVRLWQLEKAKMILPSRANRNRLSLLKRVGKRWQETI